MTPHYGSLLVVDDQKANRDRLCRRLRRKGYTPTAAAGGFEALRLVRTQPFDLVLLDLMMPDIDGLAVLKTLRLRYSSSELPIIVITATHDRADIVDALKFGANDYVTRPIDFPAVLARIHTQVSRKRAEEALRESEERYELAARVVNDGLWDWNLITNRVYFSPRWKAILGYEDNDIGTSPDEWFERVHPEDLDRLESGLAEHCKGITPHFDNDHRVLHKNGTYRWMRSRGLVVRHADGKASRMAGSLTDITDSMVADALTGLPNRILLLDRLVQTIEHAKRHRDYLFALLFLDLDRFKVINDSLGHMVGDELLFAAAQRLEASLRSGDTVARLGGTGHTVARLGGDEYIILLDDIKDISDATRVAERIQTELTAPFNLHDHEVFVTASIGITLSTTAYDQPVDLLRDANIAMHRAKARGKACYEVFDISMHTRAVARLRVETDLRQALAHEEFRLYYQPIVSLETGKISGFEALVRWQHPQRGLVSPDAFIPVAEETGLIVSIGAWVLREACQQLSAWQKQFPASPPLLISVNLSGKQFVQPDLVTQIDDMLRDTGLAPCSVKLEVTESVLMDDTASAIAMLEQLRALGPQLGIDDFGTGYSSLSYLHHFPFDTLKIDRAFISSIGRDGKHAEIVRTIVTLAHNLGMQVIAEGVETAEHLAYLRTLGCEYGQGYWFSQPVDDEAAEALLATAPQW